MSDLKISLFRKPLKRTPLVKRVFWHRSKPTRFRQRINSTSRKDKYDHYEMGNFRYPIKSRKGGRLLRRMAKNTFNLISTKNIWSQLK